MSVSLVPLLLAAALLAAALVGSFGATGLETSPATLLLAPILHLTAARLRTLWASGLVGVAVPSSAGQVLFGTLLIGGVAHFFPGQPVAFAAGGLAVSLLAGLVLSLGEPGALPGPELPAGAVREGPARFSLLLEAHSSLTLVLAVPLVAVLGQGVWSSGRFTVEPGALLATLGVGCAAGVTAGFAGGALLRVSRSWLPEIAVHLATAEAAALAAVLGGGSPPLAMVTSGLVCGWLARESVPVGSERVLFLFSLGILIVAGAGLDLGQLGLALPAGAFLWVTSVLVRLLVHTGFGGVLRWRRPRDLPAAWLPALAWSSYPGAAAAGLLLQGLPSGSPGPGLWTPPAPLLAIAMALLLQGATQGVLLRRAGRGPVPSQVHDLWERLSALTIALRAERRAIEEIERLGDLDDEAADSMREAIEVGERRVEASLLSLSSADPSLRARQLTAAVRSALAAGREAVAGARLRGWLSHRAAEEVERDLSRRWSRAGLVSLHELLGGTDAWPAGRSPGPPPGETRS